MYIIFIVSFKEKLAANLRLIAKERLVYEKCDLAIYYNWIFSKKWVE